MQVSSSMPNSDGCEVEEDTGTLPIEDLLPDSMKASVLGFWYSHVDMEENLCNKGGYGLVSGTGGIVGNGMRGAFISIEVSLICESTVKVEVVC